jgi:hypothetical protein
MSEECNIFLTTNRVFAWPSGLREESGLCCWHVILAQENGSGKIQLARTKTVLAVPRKIKDDDFTRTPVRHVQLFVC